MWRCFLSIVVEQKLTELLFYFFLILLSVEDVREKRVPVWQLVAMGLVIFVGNRKLYLEAGAVGWVVFGINTLPGLFCLSCSYFTKEQVGYGDSILVFLVGIMKGWFWCCVAVFIGLWVSLIVGILWRKKWIPFIPFLTVGCMVTNFF